MPRSWVPIAAGYAAMAIGVLDILRAVLPAFRKSLVGELTGFLPGTFASLAQAVSLVLGILIVMLAHGLRRRKNRAWRAVMVLLPLSALMEFLHSHHPFTAILTTPVIALLVARQREFYALSDPRTRWRALWNLLVLLVLDIGLGWVVVNAHPKTTVGDPSAEERLQHVLLGLIGVEGPVRYSSERTADLVFYSLLGLGALTAVTTLYLALRPERPVAELDPRQEETVRELLARHGARDSLGYFALRRDKSVVFSPTGKAVIAYRVVSGVMLASGDPIGDVEAWPGAIRRFLEEAERHAWVPAVIGCSETGGEVWTREGRLSALEIGDEAVIDVAAFTLEGRTMRNVRQMVNRVERAGYTCLVRRVGDLTEAEKDRIRYAADSWRGTDTERGFSMALGRFGDPADAECVVVTAHRPAETTGNAVETADAKSGGAAAEGGTGPGEDIHAVLHFVPWGRSGMSLDLMRRDHDADPGLNDLLIVKALQAAPALGVSVVSLNFAMFRAALARGERLGAGPILRAWYVLLVFLSRWFQIESLYRFNAKFQPLWKPRFLVYPAVRDLPRIGVSALQAEAFISLCLPGIASRRLRIPRRASPRTSRTP
ncbi:phosphatidylglycerol lysyltransferase domain-containing protein [Streptosporangium sp. NBC_01495]|uniref:phosphatidylglycerol lysyltransferase domain-containing protein n=1 Tax=Streptosporangium sp. NBC_01495 TaxID=2903899 RepID=UPI002E32BE59|nr:phosphatidylglycerol lysyltransferase domain-containing protein [Streptosporangium sp. NBC_01495]